MDFSYLPSNSIPKLRSPRRISLVAVVLFILIISPKTVSAPSLDLSGFVFCDQNQNGCFDSGETGIPNVPVAYDQFMTQTDSSGRYQLPYPAQATTIFVSQPAGYRYPLDEDYLPQNYYHHQPHGSPSYLRYRGIRPTGNVPIPLNFPLYRTAVDTEFTALVIADPQVKTQKQLAYFESDLLRLTDQTGFDLCLILGDLVHDHLHLFEKLRPILAKPEVPIFALPGNHDMNYRAPTDMVSLDSYRRHFGAPYYSFSQGKVHFVCLDNIEWMGAQAGEKRISRSYRGRLSAAQLAWLEADLATIPNSHLIVLAMHIPLYSQIHQGRFDFVQNRDALLSILNDFPRVLVLCGHTHTIEQVDLTVLTPDSAAGYQSEMICGAACGAWWRGPKDRFGIPQSNGPDGSPRGMFLFRFRGNQYSYRFIPSSNPDSQIEMRAPRRPLSRRQRKNAKIVVNFFSGNQESELLCQIGDLEPVTMQNEKIIDPWLKRQYLRYSRCYTFPYRLRRSTHIWTAPIPAELCSGSYPIRIQACDGQGNTFFTESQVIIR